MNETYDLVVIGGGPGGYVAAIRAAQLGLKTACVEKRDTLGGTCLNVGCIPSKSLLHSTHMYHEADKNFAQMGLNIDGLSVDLAKMMESKQRQISTLTKGISGLFKKNAITLFQGHGKIAGAGRVSINGDSPISAKHILIATGSEPVSIPGVEIDEQRLLSSTGALNLTEVPKHLVVVGGGVIGLELGSVWSRLGAKVTIVEFLDQIGGALDSETSKQFQRILAKQGLKFQLSTKVTRINQTAAGLRLNVEDTKEQKSADLEADYCLIAVGRRPYTNGLGLETLAVQTDARGCIPVDEQLKVADGVWAIGDVVSGPMLAHKAEEEGIAVVERIAGQKPHVNYKTIPSVIYTHPEVASVGATEEQLNAEGATYKKGVFPFQANSRARATGQGDGFVKILADAKTDAVLGAHIIGPSAGDMIHELVTIMEFGGSAEDIARSSHAHPTFSEAIKEAALAVDLRPIHI